MSELCLAMQELLKILTYKVLRTSLSLFPVIIITILDPRQGFTIPDVYDEIREFVTERDPETIAVNFSDWFPVADGISYTQYVKLERTSGEVSAQTLIMARQIALETLSTIVTGVTASKDIRKGNLMGGVWIYYSAQSKRTAPPDHRWWIYDPEYVLQRGDFFAYSVGYNYMGFRVDTQIHVYILREGETRVLESIQYAWNQGKKAQGIIRPHVKVGMTGGESLSAIVKAMEEAGYIYVELPDIGIENYKIIQKALAHRDQASRLLLIFQIFK